MAIRRSMPDPGAKNPPITKGAPWLVLPYPDGDPLPAWSPERTWTSDGSDGRDAEPGRAA